MPTVDGSAGEGYGRVLLTFPALSTLRGIPLRIGEIRAGCVKTGFLHKYPAADAADIFG